MSRIGIITDSTLDLTDEFLENDEVEEVSLMVFINKNVYDDGEIPDVEIARQIKEGVKITTSQPNAESFTKAYDKLVSRGYDEIIVFCCSSKVSGTINSARLARENYKKAKIKLYDTRAVGLGAHQFIYTALEMSRRGCSVGEIVNTLDEAIMFKNECFYIVDDLTAMVGTGRISAEEADLANKAKIKPILRTTDEGKMSVVERIRTSKMAIKYCIDSLDAADLNYQIEVANINNEDNMTYMIKKIKEKYPNIRIIEHTNLSSVTAAHFGIGLLSMSFMRNKPFIDKN